MEIVGHNIHLKAEEWTTFKNPKGVLAVTMILITTHIYKKYQKWVLLCTSSQELSIGTVSV